MRVDDVLALETWSRLKNDPTSQLVDVRTKAEWTFVGLPDLKTLGRQVIFVEWQTFPDGYINTAFVPRLCSLLNGASLGTDTHLFFICRTGGRSRLAAETMAEAGYPHCHNVSDGFEGPLDAQRQRGKLAGWKAVGLPWQQS
ncbi:MAG: rhodanese-like domain-containing protein [Hyphomicrobium sp.]